MWRIKADCLKEEDEVDPLVILVVDALLSVARELVDAGMGNLLIGLVVARVQFAGHRGG